MTYTVWTEEGRSEVAQTRREATLHWELLKAHGYTPEEMTEA